MKLFNAYINIDIIEPVFAKDEVEARSIINSYTKEIIEKIEGDSFQDNIEIKEMEVLDESIKYSFPYKNKENYGKDITCKEIWESIIYDKEKKEKEARVKAELDSKQLKFDF